MHFSPETEPLGIVEEARRRREQYARYIERRVQQAMESAPTEREIERRVEARIAAEINRRADERLARELRQIWRYDVPQGPSVGQILQAVARVADVTTGDLVAPRRQGALEARDLAVLLVSELRPDLSPPAIMRVFAGRDRKAIGQARRRARDRLADPSSCSARWHAEARASLRAVPQRAG